MTAHRPLVVVVDDNDEHGADPERIVQTIREVLKSAA